MDGNVDPEGIRLDLEWLHRVGVRGVQMFDNTPLSVLPPAIKVRVLRAMSSSPVRNG